MSKLLNTLQYVQINGSKSITILDRRVSPLADNPNGDKYDVFIVNIKSGNITGPLNINTTLEPMLPNITFMIDADEKNHGKGKVATIVISSLVAAKLYIEGVLTTQQLMTSTLNAEVEGIKHFVLKNIAISDKGSFTIHIYTVDYMDTRDAYTLDKRGRLLS